MITNKSESHKRLQIISASCIIQIMSIMCFIDNNICSKIIIQIMSIMCNHNSDHKYHVLY